MKNNENEIIENILIQCGIEENIVHCDNFISQDILDSLTMAEIVIALEDTFNIEIDAEEIIPDNFININTIVQLVKKYCL